MRRTQARRDQLPPPDAAVSLAAVTCRRCGKGDCTIILLGCDERGGASMAWCGPACAGTAGWPNLPSERQARAAGRKRTSSAPTAALGAA